MVRTIDNKLNEYKAKMNIQNSRTNSISRKRKQDIVSRINTNKENQYLGKESKNTNKNEKLRKIDGELDLL